MLDGSSRREHNANLACVISGAGIFGVTLGIMYPLLSLDLESRGVDSFLIGLNAAMTPLGLVLSAPFLPLLVRRAGPSVVMMTSLLGTAVLLAAIFLIRDLTAWFVLRFLLGAMINGLFVVSETWLNHLANINTRGRLLGKYTTVLSLGFAAGPFVIAVFGSRSAMPYALAILCCLLACLPLIANRRRAPALCANAPVPFTELVRKTSTLLVVVIALSIFDSATLSLLPIYGVREGLSEQMASLALTVFVLGNIALQYPVGWLADILDRRAVLLLCAGAGCVGGLALPYALHTPLLLWPLLFVWGGLTFGTYAVVLAILGHSFQGPSLLAGNVAFAAMWGTGGILGPVIGGAAMNLFGPSGLPLSLTAIWAVVIGVLVLQHGPAIQSSPTRNLTG